MKSKIKLRARSIFFYNNCKTAFYAEYKSKTKPHQRKQIIMLLSEYKTRILDLLSISCMKMESNYYNTE